MLAVAVIFGCAAVAVRVTVPWQAPSSSGSVRADLMIFTRPLVWAGVFVAAIGISGFFAMYSFIAPVVTEVAQLNAETVPLLLVTIGCGMTLGNLIGGISVDTSMGLTPLQGLIMGTRSGDIDPSVLFHLHRQAGLSIDQLDELLNKRSGLLGLTGDSDVRDVTARRAAGDPDAKLALDAYAYRIRHYIGAYMVALGGLDVITFTAGVGENSHLVRKLVCEGLEPFGIKLDSERNESGQRGRFEISADDSAVKLLVIPTDEELEISRQTRSLIATA